MTAGAEALAPQAAEAHPAPQRARGRLRELPGFTPLIVTYAINDIGDLMAMIALAVVVYDGTNSVWGVAGLFIASKLIPSLIAPWMTARWAHVRVGRSLPVIYTIEALLFAILAVAVIAGAPLGWLLTLAVLDGLLALTGRSLTRGVMATLFDSGGLLRHGNGFVSQLNAWLLVAATGGAYLLIELTSPVAALWADVASFLIAAVILVRHGRRLPPAEVRADGEAVEGATMRDGVRHIWERVAARRLVIGQSIAFGFTALVIPVEVVYARDSLGAGSAAYGLLLAAWGGGAIIGATAFRRSAHRNLGTIVWISTLVIGIGYSGLALAPALWLALIASVVGGAGNGAQWVSVMTALQESVDGEFYARASGVLESIVAAAPAVAYVAGAAITAATGPRTAYAIGGGVALLVGLYWALRPVAGPRAPHVAAGTVVAVPPAADGALVAAPRAGRDARARRRLATLLTVIWSLAAAATLALVVVVGLGERWQPGLLAVLVVMALLVAPLAIERPDGMISGVLLVVVLAAVVLGPAQAAVVGLAGILADSVWYRARAHTWIRPRAALGNVTAYAVFPLVAGWVALALIDRHGSVPAVAGVVTAVYLAALITNISVCGVYTWTEYGTSLREYVAALPGPTLSAEIFAVGICIAGVFGVWEFGTAGVALVAAAVVIFLALARRFLESVDNAVRAENARIVAEEQRLVAERQRLLTAYGQRFTIVKIMRALAAKDPSTARHSAAVAGYMRALADFGGFDPVDVTFCELTGLLHDVGKLYIPETVLNKPGRLDDAEYEIVKRHSVDGADFVRDLDGYGDLAAVVVAHHELWGGGGYPHGLVGDEIPEFAAMIAVCDVYDVLTSRAIYRDPVPHTEAIAILVRDKGSHFKPEIVDTFVAMLELHPDLRLAAGDGRGDERFEAALEDFLGTRPYVRDGDDPGRMVEPPLG